VKRWVSRLNILAVLAGCVMVASMLYPWWSLTLQYGGQSDIYPYIIRGPARELVGYKRSPQMTILTYLLILAIAVCFVGSLLRRWKGRISLAAAGLLALVAAWRFVMRMSEVAGRFDMPLQGHGIANYGGFAPTEVSTRLQPGLYLIAVAGILCLVASIFHDKLRLRLE
jgi:hypothetical protein